MAFTTNDVRAIAARGPIAHPGCSALDRLRTIVNEPEIERCDICNDEADRDADMHCGRVLEPEHEG